jgi:hypothetical protein
MEGSPPDTGCNCEYTEKQSQTADKGWSSGMVLDVGLTIPHRKNFCYEMGSGLGPVVGFCERSNEPLGFIKKAGYVLTS